MGEGLTVAPLCPSEFPQLVYPLRLREGEPLAQPVVALGEPVIRGQCLAFGAGADGATIHSAARARVWAIEPRPGPNMRGEVASIVLRTELDDGTCTDVRAGAEDLLEVVRRAGIVGHGGAGYPLARKLSGVRDRAHPRSPTVLVVNAMECEPPISCDQTALRWHGGAVLSGAARIARWLGINGFTLAHGPASAPWVRSALSGWRSQLCVVREVALGSEYTLGDERRLLSTLFGRGWKSGVPASLDGYLVMNVGTVLAVENAVCSGEPLISRYVTLRCASDRVPITRRLPLGATIHDALRFCGLRTDRALEVVVGGEIMGRPVAGLGAPITAVTNCVTVHEVPRTRVPEMPCIRCGRCDGACPYALRAEEMLRATRGPGAASAGREGLRECTLCGCCEPVCPSNIRLTERFGAAKSTLARAAGEDSRSRWARARSERHEERIAARRQIPAADRPETATRVEPAAVGSEVGAGDEVAAAVARVRARRRLRTP